MLILTRREDQEAVVSHQGITIRVKVAGTKSGQVKGGVEAPGSVDTVRRELREKAPG